MKYKTLRIALIAIMLSMLIPGLSFAKSALPEHTGAFYVNDFANVIDDKTENYLINYGIQLHKQNGAQVVVVTVDSTDGTPIKEYATSLFNKWEIGSKEKNNGLLLLLAIKDDDYWAVQGKGIDKTLTNDIISGILSKQLEPDFAAKNYNNGVYKTYGSFIQTLGGTWTETLATKNYVADNAGVFKQVTKDYLNQSSNRYQKTTGSGVYVVTVKNSGGKTLQEYTYMKFNSVGAGPKDVMLVMDIGGDDYHVLQGKDVDHVFTNEVISGILSTMLEPSFAKKDYSGGATKAANAFYNFFLSRAEGSLSAAAGKQGSGSGAVPAASQAPGSSEKSGDSSSRSPLFLLFIGILAVFIFAAWRGNRNYSAYGVRYNPYRQRNIRRYGNYQGYGHGRRWRNPHHHHRSSGGGSSWGNSGGGGSSSGGGSGRHSSGGSSWGNSGGGGSSSGGGSGRSSSSGGGSSGGGGNASSGGGAGRH